MQQPNYVTKGSEIVFDMAGKPTDIAPTDVFTHNMQVEAEYLQHLASLPDGISVWATETRGVWKATTLYGTFLGRLTVDNPKQHGIMEKRRVRWYPKPGVCYQGYLAGTSPASFVHLTKLKGMPVGYPS